MIAFFLFIAALMSSPGFADDSAKGMVPDSLLELGTEGSAYALVVDKSLSRLYVYRKLSDNSVVRVNSYITSTGLNGGDKQREGDQRTPEGVYYFVRLREDQELQPLYGIRAFDMNYPNQIDKIRNKNGYGIWLHGTDAPERLTEPRTSNGCVVVSNEAIREISNYITLYRTPIVIAERLQMISTEELKSDRERVTSFVRDWLQAWSTQSFEQYASCYSQGFRGGQRQRAAWMARKRAVFRATSWATIDIADLKAFRNGNDYTITFIQRYHSNLMDDAGIKWIYVQETDEGLQIVGEEWFPVGRALSGANWHNSSPSLSTIVDQLAEIAVGNNGKLTIPHPTYTVGNRKLASSGRTSQSTPVGVADFTATGRTPTGLSFRLKLENLVRDGAAQRGWLFLIARWSDGAYTSFPRAAVGADGRPQSPSSGDHFGIRWFKYVEGSLARPDSEAELEDLRCLAFSKDGGLLLETQIETETK